MEEERTPVKEKDTVGSVRSRIANDLLVIGSVLGIFGLVSSIATISDVGWQLEHIGIAAAFLVYVLAALFRHVLRYRFRALAIIGVCFALGVFNYWGWGLIGSGAIWFLVTILYSTVFLHKLAGQIVFVAVVAITALFSLAVGMNWMPQTLDFTSYASSTSSWLARLTMTIVLGLMMLVVIRQVLELLQAQVESTKQKAEALDIQAADLRAEIQRRSDTEATLETMIERLKFIDKSKSDFISQVSHELRTPISNLKLYQDLLSRRPDKASSYIPIMEEEMARITSIIDKMVLSSELEEDIALSTLVMINMGKLLVWTVANFETVAGNRGIQIKFNNPAKEYLVWGAIIQIQRVISALVDNAIKYNAGKSICIEIREKTAYYGIAVCNPVEFLKDAPHIFEPFVRGENALHLKVAGAGLGLSNARRIVQHYGGNIEMNHVTIEGQNWIEFCVWLPVGKEIA